MDLAHPGQPAITHDSASDQVAVALLSVLDQQVTTADGQLIIDFATGLRLNVGPDEHYESWQISSDDGLLIACTPGGNLTIWYPPHDSWLSRLYGASGADNPGDGWGPDHSCDTRAAGARDSSVNGRRERCRA